MGNARYRDKPCQICGAYFTSTGSGSKYCPDCQPQAAKARRMKAEESKRKERDRRAAKRPVYTCDTMENVMRCLNCTQPVCHGNCLNVTPALGEKAPKGKGLQVKMQMEELARRILAGETRKEIMDGMDISVNTYTYRRNQCKAAGLLPENW